ncbi:hemerythrin-like metal-binding domain-containing protein [Desulfovibrio sp. 3_1_syn3]|uniref:bacteriohemerythrin n=1 Tax=Desulfovibrio sp. 3_1_syn3 TaxID=457398 RepID=UPI0001E12EED|nr:bacteriohemerythrin [Desulfovibrio sp. 3_1_syn3]EFL85278.1 hemerythrin-like metal-binding domain-containing protein [Desulfovibrio sp. 3_1_syn3]
MRTTLFLLLACGLLAGAATVLAPAAPLDWILPVLALLLGGCGLILLYRAVFAPAKALERDLRGLKETAALPCDAAYGLLRPVADAAAEHAELLRRELAQARWDAEEATQSLEEWREKYKLIQAGQQLIRENLAASATRIHILSDELSRLLPSLAESGPGAAPAGEEALSCRARGADALITQFLKKFNSDLDFLNACLAQVEKFTDMAQTEQPAVFRPSGDAIVTWSDSLSTGVPAVDGQHKLLLSYINKLHRAIRDGRDEKTLLEVLDALAGYAFTHFNTEEIFFSHSDYPDVEKHIRVHDQFKAKVVEFRDAVSDGKANVDTEVLDFLKNWLIEHIQGMDVAFAPYLAKASGDGRE